MNSSFQQDEREAEVRLYNEIQGGGQQQAGYGRGGGDRRNGNRGGGEAASYFRAGGAHRQQQQAYNGFPHQAQNQNRFFDYADFHGPGPPGVGMPPPPPPPQMFDGMGMNMNAPALAQFAQNSYQFPLEPFAGQYGASVYAPHPQMDMGYQPGGEGGARFEEFAYQQQQMQGQGQNGNGMPPQGWAGSGYFGTGGW